MIFSNRTNRTTRLITNISPKSAKAGCKRIDTQGDEKGEHEIQIEDYLIQYEYKQNLS